MLEINLSNISHENEFFFTLKRYAQRLNQEKNTSLHYLQTINNLSAQLSIKDETISELMRQNQELKQKLLLYEQVMSRSRILINTGKKKLQNKNTRATNLFKRSLSPIYNYSNSKISFLIQKQKITESFVETRNELEYLKQYDQQQYQKLQRKIKNQKDQSIIIKETNNCNIKNIKSVNDQVFNHNKLYHKYFPIFDDFVIIKPTQNTHVSTDNLSSLNLVFSLYPEQINIQNKVFEGIVTYLCHNKGQGWAVQEYKPQIVFSPSLIPGHSVVTERHMAFQQQFQDPISLYLSNSPETLKPIVSPSINTNQKISSIYEECNPSLYYFGICYKSQSLEYINGNLFKVPLIYCFVTRHPFLVYWKQLLDLIVQKLNFKNQKDLLIFRQQLRLIKEKSLDKQFGIFSSNESKTTKLQNFEFDLLLKHIAWKKIKTTMQQKIIEHQQQKNNTNNQLHTQNIINNLPTNQNITSVLSSTIQNLIPSIILPQIIYTFSSYNIQLIIDVLLLLMLEIPIAIISKNESLLQKFMFYFVYIIKPLKYPFPIVFNLPESMSIVLESPFPSFIGITNSKIIEPYMFQRAVFDLDEKVAKSWPKINFYNSSRECMIKWISKILQKQQKEIIKLQKINQIIKILITSSKNYSCDLKELRTYRKYFKKTQIWHIYNYSQQQKPPL